nr:MAG TPA: hypothetical protein [Caudoviricetes sp.]
MKTFHVFPKSIFGFWILVWEFFYSRYLSLILWAAGM